MKRFVSVLALVVLSGAVYAAASSGAQQAGPTAKQFNALKKTVTKLQKQVKSAQTDADTALGFLVQCVIKNPVAVDSVGSATDGYLFGAPQAAGTANAEAATTALNLAASTETSPQYRMYVVNTADSACVNAVNSAATLASTHFSTFAAHH